MQSPLASPAMAPGLAGVGADDAVRDPVRPRLQLCLLRAPGPHLDDYVGLLWQVFVVSLPVMTARELVWRKPEPRVETRTIVVPPLPEAEAVFRRRLSAKRRTARLDRDRGL
jgi:hypothetical protein